MAVRKRNKRLAAAWQLRLYISDHSPRSLLALKNLENLCEKYLQRGYDVRIIDIRQNPEIAVRDNILAVPTLKCLAPRPERTVIGSLSDGQMLRRWLGLDAAEPASDTRPGADVLAVQPMGRA